LERELKLYDIKLIFNYILILIYLCRKFWSSVYKIKFLTFDSVCLFAVYLPTVILEHNCEICVGKVQIFGVFALCVSSERNSRNLLWIVRDIFKILFGNYTKKIGAILSFVKTVTSKGRFEEYFYTLLGYSEIVGLLTCLLFLSTGMLKFVLQPDLRN